MIVKLRLNGSFWWCHVADTKISTLHQVHHVKMKSMIFTALYIEIITISQPRRVCIQTMNRRKSESISLYFGRGIRIECANEMEAKSLYPFISERSLSPFFIYHLGCRCLFFVSPQKHIQSCRSEIIIHMSLATSLVCVCSAVNEMSLGWQWRQ